MRVVVAVDGMSVARHFEQCSSLTIYTVTNGIVTHCQNIPNPGPPFDVEVRDLVGIDVKVLIVDSILPETKELFESAGIEVACGASGTARNAIDCYLTRAFIDCF